MKEAHRETLCPFRSENLRYGDAAVGGENAQLTWSKYASAQQP